MCYPSTPSKPATCPLNPGDAQLQISQRKWLTSDDSVTMNISVTLSNVKKKMYIKSANQLIFNSLPPLSVMGQRTSKPVSCPNLKVRGSQIIDRLRQEANVWFPRLHHRSWERDLSSLHKQTRSRFWERDREGDRLAGRNARICWSWDFFPLQSFFLYNCILQPHKNSTDRSFHTTPLTVSQQLSKAISPHNVSIQGFRNLLCQIWLHQHLLFQVILEHY